MRRTLLLGVALLGAIAPALALAQSQAPGAAPLLEKEAPVDEVERGLRCSNRFCRGAVRVALIHDDKTEGFVGGMA